MHKYHNTASGLASLGRHGDSMLVHMSPGEVASLQKMAELKGGSLTINPHTGLPEAGFLKDFLPMIAGGIAALFTGGMSLPAQLALQGGSGLVAGKLAGNKAPWWAQILGGVGGGATVGMLSGLGAPAVSAAEAATAPGMTSLAATPASSLGGIEGALATDLTAPLATSAAPGALSAATSSAIPTITADLGGIGASGASSALGAIPSMAGVTAPLATSAYSPVALANSVTPSLNNVGTGLGKVLTGSPEATGFLRKAAVPLMMSAAPMLAAQDQAPGKPIVKPTPFYNTTFNRRINPNYGKPGESMYIDSYGPGSFSKDYLYGSNLMPAPGQGQLASDSTLGSFDNPFKGSAPIGMKSGGEVHFDAGGATGGGLADMHSYYQNLMTPKAPAPTSGGADHSAYLSSLAATPFNPNFAPAPTSMDMAGTAPQRMGMGDATDANGVTTPNVGGGGFHPFGGMGYSYSYDPTTQSFGGGESPDYMRDVANFRFAKGGLANLGGSYAAGGKLLRGGGDGMSDSIPAVIRGKKPQRAALADGEFVVPADVVSHLGNGSTEAGGRRLYAMMDRVRKARTGRKKQAPAVKAHKYLPA